MKNRNKKRYRKLPLTMAAVALLITAVLHTACDSFAGNGYATSDTKSEHPLSGNSSQSQTSSQAASRPIEEVEQQTTTDKPSNITSTTEAPAPKPETTVTSTTEAPAPKPETTVTTTTEAPAPKPETTVTTTTEAPAPKPETTVTTTTEAPAPKPETTVTTTTEPPAPKPLWTENETGAELKRYVTVDCYSRKQALQGTETVKLLKRGTAVYVIAFTDTSYCKLKDGSFVHKDYISEEKPAETTTTITEKPQTTPKPEADKPVPDSSGGISFSEMPTAEPIGCTKSEAEVFRLINKARADAGKAALKWDPSAYKAAKIRAKEIYSSFSHTRPDGSSWYSVYGLGEKPFSVFSNLGENIAAGQQSAEEVFEAWMNSQGHRENILNGDYENVAIALFKTDNGYRFYWTQEFTTYK